MGTRFGTIVQLVVGLPRELYRAPDVGPEDMIVIADKMAHAAAQCRTLAACKPERSRRLEGVGAATPSLRRASV